MTWEEWAVCYSWSSVRFWRAPVPGFWCAFAFWHQASHFSPSTEPAHRSCSAQLLQTGSLNLEVASSNVAGTVSLFLFGAHLVGLGPLSAAFKAALGELRVLATHWSNLRQGEAWHYRAVSQKVSIAFTFKRKLSHVSFHISIRDYRLCSLGGDSAGVYTFEAFLDSCIKWHSLGHMW